MASIELQRVTKAYPGGITALRNVSCLVEDQEFVAVVGPSGCGKSTLLRVIAGLEAADEGSVRMDAQDVERLAPRKRDIAMVFQGESLYPHLSVSENIAFPLRMRKVASQEITRRVTEVAGQLGVTDLLARKPETLSGGQRQRVALGRALVRHPRAFLLDEPLSNLDAHLRRQLCDELRRLRRHWAATTIFVTHDQQEAMSLGDRVAVMHNGRILQCDRPQQLLTRPANRFVASFVGDPPMNFLQGTIQVENQHVTFHSPDLTFTLSRQQAAVLNTCGGAHVELGLRPQAIGLADAIRNSAASQADAELAFFPATVLGGHWVGGDWEIRLQLECQTELLCRSPRMLSQPGQQARFAFDPAASFFFGISEAGTDLGPNLVTSRRPDLPAG